MGRFPHIPREAVLKEDLLRGGMAFDDSALTDNLRRRGQAEVVLHLLLRPEAAARAGRGRAAPPAGGDRPHRRPVRPAPHRRLGARQPDSPYRVVARRGRARCGSPWTAGAIADVGLPPMPEYYRHTLANGKSVMETAPTIQWGYLIYLTVLRVCQYFGAKEECQFCDINHNWRQHKPAGRPYTGVKPVDEVLEALAIIDRYDTDAASQGLHAHRRLDHLQGRRAGRGRLLRPLRPGHRGALPRPLDRQGRRPGAAEGRRAALQGLRHQDLPPQLRGVGQAAVRAVSAPARSATWAARSGTGASWTRPRCSGRAT